MGWAINAGLSLVGLGNSLLSEFQFRQLQTAMSVLFYPAAGFPLAYPTPLMGPPWSIPLEFPLYQASVAWFIRATGLAMDPAGRIVSWLWFQAALPGVYLLLGSLNIERSKRWITLALLVTSPLYLYYSRSFMIESCVMCCSVWFLVGYCRWITTGRRGWLTLALLSGALAAAIKPTTLLGFSVGAGLFTLWQIKVSDDDGWRPFRRIMGRAVAAFSLPVIVGLLWQQFTAVVRAQNPESAFLDVMFGYFSFGDLEQRLSGEFWERTSHMWFNGVLSTSGAMVGVILLFLIPRRQVAIAGGLALTFLSSQLVFSNLFAIHDYYFYANGLFLLMALGIILSQPLRGKILPFWKHALVISLVAATQIAVFARDYFPAQSHNIAPPEVTQIINDITDPSDTIIVLGQDWDAETPYYAQRKALMLTAGRERDLNLVKKSIERLDPTTVGAVVVFGHFENHAKFLQETMESLDLGSAPLFAADTLQINIWVPRPRQSQVRNTMRLAPYPTFDLAPPTRDERGRIIAGPRAIRRLRAFDTFSPRPVRAVAPGNFDHIEVAGIPFLNTHTPSDFLFRVPAGATMLELSFGMHDIAFTRGNASDGFEIAITDQRAGDETLILLQRVLDPMHRAEDRGIQRIKVPVVGGASRDLRVQLLPGPAKNASYDWVYLGHVRLH